MKALIIDDEKTGAAGLKILIEQHCPDIQLEGIEYSAPDGIKRILEVKPDLVFLDIEMSPDTGFDVIEATKELDYHVIFTTAYDSYAIKAFKAQAVDYLLKPIDVNELKEAVKNALKRSKKSTMISSAQLESVIKNMREPLKKIPLPTSNGITLVSVEDILYFESDSNYTQVFLKSGNRMMVSKTLKSFDEKLSNQNFCRVHAAFMVNLNEIDRYIKGDGGTIIMKTNPRSRFQEPISMIY